MLDDVERRRFLVQPARENAVPRLVGLQHIDLDERARELLFFPWSRRFAGPKPDDDVLPAHRLPRMKSHVLYQAVALVENADDRDTLRHRSHARLIDAGRRRGVGDDRRRSGPIPLCRLPAAGSQRRRKSQQSGVAQLHAYSGIQGW